MRRCLQAAFLSLALLVLGLPLSRGDAGTGEGQSGQSAMPHPGVIWEARVREPVVALTFDDGPDPVYTPQLLDLLQRYGARATFFVTGRRTQEYPDLVARTAAEGHQVGNHGLEHKDYSGLAPEAVVAEVTQAGAMIQELTGKRPNVFRPPFGAYTSTVVDLLEQHDYHLVLWTWSTNSQDSLDHPSTEEIVDRILQGVKPGAIILLHDHGGDRRPMVAAVERVLAELGARGYRFVTLDELLQTEAAGG